MLITILKKKKLVVKKSYLERVLLGHLYSYLCFWSSRYHTNFGILLKLGWELGDGPLAIYKDYNLPAMMVK